MREVDTDMFPEDFRELLHDIADNFSSEVPNTCLIHYVNVKDVLGVAPNEEAGFDEDDWKRIARIEQLLTVGREVLPIVLNKHMIYDGVHRIVAARRLGVKRLPCIDIRDWGIEE